MALIIDTGPLYASLDRRDAYHAVCRALIDDTEEELVIPAPVLVEVDYFVHQAGRPESRRAFLNDILTGAYRIESLVPEDYVRVRDLCERYADARVGFVDAAVLAIVERLNEPKLATLDRRHFGLMPPRHVASLKLLPQ